MRPGHLADLLDVLGDDRRLRPAADDLIDLVWTGPEAAGVVNRDTGVVVRELFQNARESVLVAGYAVYQGHVVFKALAERMDQDPGLARPDVPGRPAPPTTIQPFRARAPIRRTVRRSRSGPAGASPSSTTTPGRWKRISRNGPACTPSASSWTMEQAFVSSANFTGAAQTKNIEVGVNLRHPSFARRLAEHFEALASAGLLKPIPLPES